MTFAQLPGIYVSWVESTEPLATFIAYRVYRRALTEDAFTLIKVISSRTIPFMTDYTVASGIVYEYDVRVVADSFGDEVESVAATVQSSVTFVDSFLHDAASPGNYAALNVVSQNGPVTQDIGWVTPAGRSLPTAHVGNGLQQGLRLTLGSEPFLVEDPADSRLVWTTLRSLQLRQYTAAAVLCYRDARGTRLFCNLVTPNLSDQDVSYGAQLDLREVFYREAVN